METKTMQEVIKENYEKTRLEKIKRNEQAKKELKKEKILTFVIAVFILAMTVMWLRNINNKMISNCTDLGYSIEYCERGI